MKAVSIFPAPATGWRSVFSFFIFSLLLLPVFTGSVAAQTSLPGYTPPPAKPMPELPLIEKVRRGKAPLSRIATQVRLESVSVHRLPVLSAREMRSERKSTRLRIGATRQLNRPLSAQKDGTAFQLSEGKLFLLRVATEGAVMARLHFKEVALSPGARLFVYSRTNPDDFHPLHLPGENGLDVVGQREFWTPPLTGEEIVVEYLAPDNGAADASASAFVIDQISHIFVDPRSTQQDGASACNLNVPAEWSEAAKSVGLIQFSTPKGEFACSGVLINNNNNDGTPYFLTANHCLGRATYVRTLIVHWLYNSGDRPDTGMPVSNSGQLLATGTAGDFTLLQLNYVPPGVHFAGWTAEIPVPATVVRSIHHPKASFKRFSSGRVLSGVCPSGLPGACEHFLAVQWQEGITEPGSSGGPLWTGPATDPRVVGTLSGGLSSCNNRNGEDFYGRFDLAFAAIAPYLTGQGCAFAIETTKQGDDLRDPQTREIFSAAGGDGSVKLKVRTGTDCGWTIASEASWITVTSPAAGAGDAVVTYSTAPHIGSTPRSGYLLIAGHRLLVTQMAVSACGAVTASLGQTFNSALSNSDCRSSLDPEGYADRYTLTVQAGQQVSINLVSSDFDAFLLLQGPDGKLMQFQDDFAFSSNPKIPYFDGFLELTTAGEYTLEATSYEPGETGTYRLEIHRGCPMNFAQEPALLPAAGGNGQLNVKTPPGCSWTAQVMGANWLTLASNNGNGPGAITFTAMANPTLAYDQSALPRAAQLNITTNGANLGITSPNTFAPYVLQNYGCGFQMIQSALSIKPYEILYGSPSQQHVGVRTGNGCPWTARSNVPWMEFYERGPNISGTGSQALQLTFDSIKLGDMPRIGTLTMAGQTVTVTQESIGTICPPGELNVGQTLVDSLSLNCRSIGGSVGYVKQYKFRGRAGQRVAITLNSIETFPRVWVRRMLSDDEMALTFRENQESLDLQEGKALRLPRTGFMTLPADGMYLIDVAGSSYWVDAPGTFVISLMDAEAVGCDLTLSTNRASVAGSGGYGSVKVSGTCAWTAVSASPWIKITSSANGKVEYTVDPNPGAYRTGAISVGGQNLLMTQTQANAPISVVSAADYQPTLTIGGIHALFGNGLASQTLVATTQPLPTALDGTQIVLTDDSGRDYNAQLFFVSPGQINFRVELNVPQGAMNLTVKRNGQSVASTRFVLSRHAPALFTADGSGRGVPAAYLLRVRRDNSRIEEPIYDRDATGRITPRLIRLTDDEDVYLILYGTGFYAPYPSVWEAEATLQSTSAQTVQKGLATAAPGFAGLDQVNLLLPRSLRGQGDVTLIVKRGGASTNPVTIRIAP